MNAIAKTISVQELNEMIGTEIRFTTQSATITGVNQISGYALINITVIVPIDNPIYATEEEKPLVAIQ